jgi:hypothetical protein
MFKITVPKSRLKSLTAILPNKLSNTFNILSSGVLVKANDLEKVLSITEKLSIKVSYQKVGS